MKALTEAQHQMAVFKWSRQPKVREKYPELALLFHIPNGGTRDPVEGRRLKLAGVKPGVPDLCLPVPRGDYAALYIEVKKQGGATSIEQRWWVEKLNLIGNFAEVCHGWESAVRVLEWYLGSGKEHKNA